jgi:hypothetical protein
MRSLHLFLLYCVLTGPVIFAQSGDTAPVERARDALRDPIRFCKTAAGTTVNDHFRFMDINRIGLWLGNNGCSAHNPHSDGSGLRWPLPENRYLIFQNGPVWSATLGRQLHVGGSTYSQGLQAGAVDPATGQPDDPADPRHRVYLVTRMNRAAFMQLSAGQQDSLRMDFEEWPAALGAPFIDNDGNGVYDPDFETWLDTPTASDHPFFPGEQVLWFVANDMDKKRVSMLYGSAPIGIELQVFAWASPGHPLLDNTVFIEYTLINRGEKECEDFRFAQWSDADLGDAVDDMSGIDTTLSLHYTYNGESFDDVYGWNPPAFGYAWLQTPVTPEAGAEADYGFRTRTGYRNAGLAAYTFYVCSSPTYQDPDLHSPTGAVQMTQNMHGRLFDGAPMTDPVTGGPTSFALSGDPVLQRGWHAGLLGDGCDVRDVSASDGTLLAPGDTQKVIIATTVAATGNHILSLHTLRSSTRQLHDFYRNRRCVGAAPQFSSALYYPGPDSWAVSLTAGPFAGGTLRAVLEDAEGNVIVSTALADDGRHGDGTAGDGIFGGTITGTNHASAATLSVLHDDGREQQSWFVRNDIPLSGRVRVAAHAVLSDNLNFDGRVNPGENIRLQLRLENRSVAAIDQWHLFFMQGGAATVSNPTQHCSLHVEAGEDGFPAYDGSVSETYLQVQVPADHPPGQPLLLPVAVISEERGLWYDTLRVRVDPIGAAVREGLLQHVEGPASGTLGWRLAESEALRRTRYRVDVEGAWHEALRLRVTDEGGGRVLAEDLPFPDTLAHDAKTLDGWRLLRGSSFHAIFYDEEGEYRSPYIRTVLPEWSHPERAWFEDYAGYLVTGEEFFGSALRLYDLHPVRLVFDRGAGQRAYRWLRGAAPSYGYQDYRTIPVRAYDVSDSSAPRQITLGYVENMGRPGEDGTWMPGSPADREYLFIFADDYHETAQQQFMRPIIDVADSLDCYYALWPQRDDTFPMFEDGDSYTLIPHIPVSAADAYILDLTQDEVFTTGPVPLQYTLHQNYPNPATVNGGTEILFDTPEAGNVRIAVYDLLGRRVRTLVDGTLSRGRHSVRFLPGDLAAGVYVVELRARGVQRTRLLQLLR